MGNASPWLCGNNIRHDTIFTVFLFSNFGDGNTNTGTVGNSSTDTNSTVRPGDIQFDIFNAVVFIVAGPAIGFTMSQAVIFFSFLIFFQDKYKFLLAYSHLRAVCSNEARSELDAMDARIIFNSSTGVGLLFISFLLVIQDWLDYFERFSKPLLDDAVLHIRIFIISLNIVVGIILIVSAWLEVSRIRLPLVCGLLKI